MTDLLVPKKYRPLLNDNARQASDASGEHVVRILHLRDALAAAVLQLSVWTFFDRQLIEVGHHAVMLVKARHTHWPLNLDLAQRGDKSVLILHTSFDVLESLDHHLGRHVPHVLVRPRNGVIARFISIDEPLILGRIKGPAIGIGAHDTHRPRWHVSKHFLRSE